MTDRFDSKYTLDEDVVNEFVNYVFSNEIFADEHPVHAVENYVSSYPDNLPPSLEDFKKRNDDTWIAERYAKKFVDSLNIDDVIYYVTGAYDEDELRNKLVEIITDNKQIVSDAVTEYIYEPDLFEEVKYWSDNDHEYDEDE